MSKSASTNLHLTPRDQALIAMVHRFGGCTVDHLHARFWPEESTRSACYRRVARLVKERYLVAERLPSVTSHGSGKAFLTVGLRGRRVVAEQWGISPARLPRQEHVAGVLFIQHHCAICDVRLAIERAVEQRDDVSLEDWIPEPQLKRAPMKVTDSYTANGTQAERTIVLIPDGAFTLETGGRKQQGFLEMDMGTLSLKRLQLKIRGYMRLHRTLPVPIFFVTLTARRAAQIVHSVESVADDLHANPTMFFVATSEYLGAETILALPVWQQVGRPAPVAILPQTQPGGSTDAAGAGQNAEVWDH